MNTRTALALYVAAWAALLASLLFGLTRAGVSTWLSVLLAYALFVVVNGALAHRYRIRQPVSRGSPRPSYLKYLLVGEGVKRDVHVPKPLRLALAAVVGSGGVLFMVVALVIAVQFFTRQATTSALGTFGLAVLTALFGATFLFVGARLALAKDGERLFPRSRFFQRRKGA